MQVRWILPHTMEFTIKNIHCWWVLLRIDWLEFIIVLNNKTQQFPSKNIPRILKTTYKMGKNFISPSILESN